MLTRWPVVATAPAMPRSMGNEMSVFLSRSIGSDGPMPYDMDSVVYSSCRSRSTMNTVQRSEPSSDCTLEQMMLMSASIFSSLDSA